MLTLARRGVTMLGAKRAIKALLEDGRVFVELPAIEDVQAVVRDLAKDGIASASVEPPQSIDVKKLREDLKLTREQFALRYGIEVETVRNWEINKRVPDTTARSYLRVIANDPEHVEQAYAPTPKQV